MGQYTSRVNLYLPGGGSSGLITPDEEADIDKLNENFKKIDLALGTYFCLSTTHPAMPFDGQQIYETDTHKFLIWDSSSSTWVDPSTVVPYADNTETQAGVLTNKAVTPAGLASLIASTTQAGLVELATDAEAITGTDTSKAVTPHALRAATTPVQGQIPSSVTVGSGSASVATDGTVTFTGCSSVSLNGVFTGGSSGVYKLYVHLQASAGVNQYIRLRNAGTDITANYNRMGISTYSAGGPARSVSFPDSVFLWLFPYTAGTAPLLDAEATVFNPGSSFNQGIITSISAASDRFFWQQYGQGIASADGVSLVSASGTSAGTIKVVKIA